MSVVTYALKLALTDLSQRDALTLMSFELKEKGKRIFIDPKIRWVSNASKPCGIILITLDKKLWRDGFFYTYVRKVYFAEYPAVATSQPHSASLSISARARQLSPSSQTPARDISAPRSLKADFPTTHKGSSTCAYNKNLKANVADSIGGYISFEIFI